MKNIHEFQPMVGMVVLVWKQVLVGGKTFIPPVRCRFPQIRTMFFLYIANLLLTLRGMEYGLLFRKEQICGEPQ